MPRPMRVSWTVVQASMKTANDFNNCSQYSMVPIIIHGDSGKRRP